MAHTHRMPPTVPRIEIADHSDALGIRCPNSEAHAVDPAKRYALRAEGLRQFEMASLIKQMQVKLAQQQTEGIRILGLLDRIRPRDTETVRYAFGHQGFKQSVFGRGHKRRQQATIISQGFDLECAGKEGANDPTPFDILRSKHVKRIVVRTPT